jgi:hypothetical protein
LIQRAFFVKMNTTLFSCKEVAQNLGYFCHIHKASQRKFRPNLSEVVSGVAGVDQLNVEAVRSPDVPGVVADHLAVRLCSRLVFFQ